MPLSSYPSDLALVDALRRNERAAWSAFYVRFRPVLESYARKANIPSWEWPICVNDLLADEALRLSKSSSEPPRRLDAYLVRAVRNKYLYGKRGDARRDRSHHAASVERCGERIIPSTCSDHARRASNGPEYSSGDLTPALQRFAARLTAELSAADRQLLTWVADGVSRADIAAQLGVKPDTCAKRIWRLCGRLRADAVAQASRLSATDRAVVERFLRRAGITDGLSG